MAAIETGLAIGVSDAVYLAPAQLALLAAKRGEWREAGRLAREDRQASTRGPRRLLDQRARARDDSTHRTPRVRGEDARAALTRAHRLRPLLDHGVPWLSIAVGLELTRAHLTLADAGAARTVFAETERILELRPHMGILADDARELRPRVEATGGSTGAWAMSLTAAELRLLPFLATHLTFPEIASRLFISRNTVKSEAVAVYRKHPPAPGLTLH